MTQDEIPDRDSENQQETTETTLPARESARQMTVVGIGASAGGVRALQDFFKQVAPGTGSAFVVVVHLAPEYESHLSEVLSRATTLPVQQVTEAVALQPDQVYVIPPGQQMVIADGYLQLMEPPQPQGRRVVIDHFFRTLANAYGPQAVAVILSGTGADGTLGLKQIKEVGGLTIAQEPFDADHEGCPATLF